MGGIKSLVVTLGETKNNLGKQHHLLDQRRMASTGITEMDKISYSEYLDALEKVNLFLTQLKNDDIVVKAYIKNNETQGNESHIIELLQTHATRRLIDAVSSFLDSETAYRKIPFTSAETVTVSFFIQKYKLSELKKIRNLGTFSLLSLNNILQRTGHSLLK